MHSEVKIDLPNQAARKPQDGDLYYTMRGGVVDLYSLYDTLSDIGRWITSPVGGTIPWGRANTIEGATSGLTPVPPGSVITITVKE